MGLRATAFVLSNAQTTIQSTQGKEHTSFSNPPIPVFHPPHTTTEMLFQGQNSDNWWENSVKLFYPLSAGVILACFKCQAVFKDLLGHVHICTLFILTKGNSTYFGYRTSPNTLTGSLWIFMYLFCIKYLATFSTRITSHAFVFQNQCI